MRTVTIDRARRARMIRDLFRDPVVLRSSWWQVGAVLVGLVVVVIGAQAWRAGVLTGIAVCAVQLLLWWLRADRTLRRELPIGSVLTLTYRGEELIVSDATEEVRLPRGSVVLIRRTGGNLSVYGRSHRFLVPAELLTEDDIAFLEGHRAATLSGPAPGGLPMAVEITPRIQEAIVSAATRAVARSADFWIGWFSVAIVLAFGVLAQARGIVVLAALLAVLPSLGVVHWLRMPHVWRMAYPVGRVLRGEVTPEHLALSRLHGTVVEPWTRFSARRVTPDVVLLRRRRRPLAKTVTVVVPRELFRDSDLQVLEAAVPRRF